MHSPLPVSSDPRSSAPRSSAPRWSGPRSSPPAPAARAAAGRRTIALLALAVAPLPFAAGCLPSAEARDAEAYVEAMTPVLTRNMDLTREFVDVATEVKRGKADPQTIAGRFERTLVPESAALHEQVTAISPETPALAATHQQLVSAWEGRAAAYAALHGAWTELDPDAFDRQVERTLDLKDSERAYFEEVNGLLAAHGLSLDAYP